MFLVLVGFMGCGKSSLLNHWKKDFKGPTGDLDSLVAHAAAVNPSGLGEWIKAEGFPAFRSLESQILEKLLKEHDTYLLALGGGAFHPDNQKLIENKRAAEALWVETPVDECWRRVKNDGNRPLVAEGEIAFKELYQERVPHYRQAKYRILGNGDWPQFSVFCKKYSLNSLIY